MRNRVPSGTKEYFCRPFRTWQMIILCPALKGWAIFGMIALRDSLGTEFVERIRLIFSATGLLSKAKNFEFRPQQQEMAMAVARALEEERHLVVEAGTGVGKSLAYLVPAILFALEQHKKAIISTHTINLQEQLLLQRHSDSEKSVAGRIRGRADERPAVIMFARAGSSVRCRVRRNYSPGRKSTNSLVSPSGPPKRGTAR